MNWYQLEKKQEKLENYQKILRRMINSYKRDDLNPELKNMLYLNMRKLSKEIQKLKNIISDHAYLYNSIDKDLDMVEPFKRSL